MTKLLIATSNPGKQLELRALLSGLGAILVTPAEVGLDLGVTEDGRSYRENAQKKASLYAAASGLIALSDDTGLEVDALHGAPGLRSARYASAVGATDADRRSILLQKLGGMPRPWRARFCAAVAISMPGGETQCTEGECHGEIIPFERGSAGFGYDPIFLVDGMGRTMAELDMAEKNRISHRARAIMKARPILLRLLSA
jgi:XTP/dITP diphosphohydrolase